MSFDLEKVRDIHNADPKEFKFWYDLSTQPLPEDFIREFKNFLNWHMLSVHQVLSEELIREFKNRVVWSVISEFQILSESFIREFQNKVYWDSISCHQKMSDEFMLEFKDKVYWKWVPTISDDLLNKLPDHIRVMRTWPRFLRY